MTDQELRDKLASEGILLLEAYYQTEQMLKDAEQERDQLKAQCEKLAEALDAILWAVPSLNKVLEITRESLAEYRKQFPKDKE